MAGRSGRLAISAASAFTARRTSSAAKAARWSAAASPTGSAPRSCREKGTNRAAFLRGEVDKYTWVAEGSSFVASDVLAAILTVQLGRLPAMLSRKRALAARLSARLAPLADRVVLPEEWPGVEGNWHLYPVLVPRDVRTRVLAALQAEGIGATFHYVPLHDSPFGRDRFGYRTGDLPVTELVSASLVRLPLFSAMSDDDLEDVASATMKVVTRLVSPRPPA